MGSEKTESTAAEEFRQLSVEALRKAGCRITKPRIAVIDCLAEAERPLSAPEVFERLKKDAEKFTVDKTSVYRILEQLHELHLVHRTIPSGNYIACSHQECMHSYHVLSRCTGCGKVEELDVPEAVVAPLLFHLRSALQFTPDAHLLHIEGRCERCGR